MQEGEELPSAALDLVSRLFRRIPDDPEVSRLLVGLHASLPFELRLQAIRARLFSQQPEAADLDAALSLVVEAGEVGRSNEVADLVLMVAGLGVADPASLALCAGALEKVGRDEQAKDLWRKYTVNSPLGREQTAEDMGLAVVFLVSEDAKNITGQTLHVDGGATMR